MGPFHFVKGQVSHKGEHMMAQLKAISEMDKEKFDVSKLAKWYGFYMQSNPSRTG
jgi:hypothetical protein